MERGCPTSATHRSDTSSGRCYLRTYPGSPCWYVAWFDRGTRQTPKRTLGTSDLEAAKAECARLITLYGTLREERSDSVTIATVFDRYQEHHAKGLPAEHEQRRHLRYWRDFSASRPRWRTYTPARRHRFVERLKGHPYERHYQADPRQRGSGAALVLSPGRASQSVPHIVTVPDSEPRKRALENDEIISLWGAIGAELLELRRYIMILLNTRCRPEAARDLLVFQVDRARSQIDLNPKGRVQTSKSRPLIPITETLRPWLAVDGRERLIGRGEKWLSVRWRAAGERAGLADDTVPC